jgi:hypothetical protein
VNPITLKKNQIKKIKNKWSNLSKETFQKFEASSTFSLQNGFVMK